MNNFLSSLGIVIVPDDKIYIISCLGGRPSKNKYVNCVFGSSLLKPGFHWFLPVIHKVVYSINTLPFEVQLFRHDKGTEGDKAKIELIGMDIILRMSIQLQISGDKYGDLNDKTSIEPYWKAHYNSVNKDYFQQAEVIINPYIKNIFQGCKYELTPEEQEQFLKDNPDKGYQKDDLIVTGVANLSPEKLLKELGLRYPKPREEKSPGEGKFLVLDEKSTKVERGSNLLARLEESGLKIINIFINDIELPEDVLKARSEKSKQAAEQNAKLESAKIQEQIIKQENANLLEETKGQMTALAEQREGEAKALKIQQEGLNKALKSELSGFIKAVNEAEIKSGGKISAEKILQITIQYRELTKLLGQNDKFFFQGGSGQDIISQVMAAVQSTK